jgi:succinate-semialdehyde dehydrogenase/glutarate-semialdehyde dehydrogenase
MAVIQQPADQRFAEAREQITVTSPLTGQAIGQVPVFTREDVEAAARRARAAQPAWEAMGAKERARLLGRWWDTIWNNRSVVMQHIRRETGKNETGAFLEVFATDLLIGYYCNNAVRLLRPQNRKAIVPIKHHARVYYKPVGVVGAITPWNYPLLNAFCDLLAALFAGNTVLLKPSEVTPFTALYVVETMYQAGIPKDVIQVLTGDGRTGSEVVEVVDFVSFTGSTAVGRKIATRCAERLIGSTMEMGGKDAMLILNDADLELAASGTLVGALENSGQACVSTERVYVEDGIYDRYIERLKYYAGQIKQNGEAGMDVHVGSLTNERELLRAEEFIADAVAKGAKVLHGGQRRPDLGPLFFEPTILVNVNHDMRLMREETFGPLIPIMRVKDVDEAIRLANDSPYGLSGSIFSNNLKRAEHIATRIQSGDVSINSTKVVFGNVTVPMGGVKNSGIGRRNGPEGLLRFVEPQSILIDNRLFSKPNLTLFDPFLVNSAILLRALRRWIPFLRV